MLKELLFEMRYGASQLGGQPRQMLTLWKKGVFPVLSAAGIEPDAKNISKYVNLPIEDVEKIMTWAGNKRLRTDNIHPVDSSPSDASKLAAEILRLWNTKKAFGNNPVNKQSLMKALRWDEDKLTNVVNSSIDEVSEKLKLLLNGMTLRANVLLADGVSARKKAAKEQSPKRKEQMIRQAVRQMSDGQHGTITANDLAKWVGPNGERIGLDARAIDDYLTSRKDLFDLDRFRVLGKRS